MKKRNKKQLLPGIILSAAIGFLVFLYAPVDLYCSNISEFWFGFGTLFIAALGMFVLSVAIMIVIYILCWLIHPVLYRIALAGGLVVLICTYVQGNFLIRNLPPLDGSTIDWNNYTVLRTEDYILWGIAAAVVILLAILLKKDLFEKVVSYAGGGLTLMLLITLVSVILTSGALKEKVHYQIGGDEEFAMSQEQNFVILLLDAVDSREFSKLIAENPDYYEAFQDFTYFENAAGAYSCTERSVPFILTGKWYENEMDFDEYVKQSYLESSLFAELSNRGYRVEYYDPETYMDDDMAALFSNVHRVKFKMSSYFKFAKQELKLIGFRYAPFDLKKKCIFKMAGFNELALADDPEDKRTFTGADHEFAGRVEDAEITTENNEKVFKYIHLDGAHVPFIYDENLNIIDELEGTYTMSVEASLKAAEDYLELLKKGNSYDNTVLIIMADHGYNGSLEEMGDAAWMRQSPLLMIKGTGEHHDTMQVSEAPVSFEDLQEAYTRLLDGRQSEEVFDWKEGDVRERRFLWYSFLDEDHMVEYMQTGHAQDMDTMVPTGREYNR